VQRNGKIRLTGLIGFGDPPRKDSKSVLAAIRELGIRVLMLTGDEPATARSIANQVGLTAGDCTVQDVQKTKSAGDLRCDVVAGVFPEDKFKLVQHFQDSGSVVAMTGDGVNDSPALKQAEVGIALSNATDIAKSAASIVLRNPGLGSIPAIIKTGRKIYQRMISYTLNKVVKTFQITFFLGLGMILTGLFITSPLHVILLLFANDFVTMSLSADTVSYSKEPEKWNIKALIVNAGIIAAGWLLLSFGVLYFGLYALHLALPQLQTLVFTCMAFPGWSMSSWCAFGVTSGNPAPGTHCGSASWWISWRLLPSPRWAC